MRYNSFYPGRPWLDTSGNRIQAHGGSVFYRDGVYYWYGENKEKTDGTNGIWHWGVRCYRSTDLYNWEDLGLIIRPEPDNPASSLHPTKSMDRPHILYNARTNKYVCWLKIMNVDGTQSETILTADDLLGPYSKIRENGKGYYFFERVHSETIIADLTDDYTDVTGYYSTHFPQPYPPYVREATAHFVRNYRHYLITSGTTGYFPNPSEAAVADTWHGPYHVLGDTHPNDASRTSYHSQISSVFRVHGKKDLYIALADRWLPELTFLEYEDYSVCYEAAFGPQKSRDPGWDRIDRKIEAHNAATGEHVKLLSDGTTNTSIADYVWLPLRFVEPDAAHPNGQVLIDWRDEWSLDEYEDEE